MTAPIPGGVAEAQRLVGCSIDEYRHIGRADHETGQVYILHPARCVARLRERPLTECPYSAALNHELLEYAWHVLQAPHYLRINEEGFLLPSGAVEEEE